MTTASGEKIEGEIERLDDFSVAIRRDDGTRRAWRIANGNPRVEVVDPLRGHRELLSTSWTAASTSSSRRVIRCSRSF